MRSVGGGRGGVGWGGVEGGQEVIVSGVKRWGPAGLGLGGGAGQNGGCGARGVMGHSCGQHNAALPFQLARFPVASPYLNIRLFEYEAI